MKERRDHYNRSNRRQKRTLITLKHYQNKTTLLIPAQKSEKEVIDIDSFFEIQEKHPEQIGQKNNKVKSIMMDQAKNF